MLCNAAAIESKVWKIGSEERKIVGGRVLYSGIYI
jgi:hypothetical protein